MDFQNQNIFPVYSKDQVAGQGVARTFMANVFLWMFAALLISATTAYLFASNGQLMQYLISFNGTRSALSIFGWIVMLAPLGVVLLMNYGYSRLSVPAMIGAFIAFAAINGISFSFILLAYTGGSIVTCFVSSAAMFGVMAVLGYTTNQDLTGMGRILIMGLIGIVVASLINMFLHSEAMAYIVSIIGVIVFTGLTAYDVQKMKRIGEGIEFNGAAAADVKKTSILGALTLYLDFVNLFLFMLRLFGGRRK